MGLEGERRAIHEMIPSFIFGINISLIAFVLHFAGDINTYLVRTFLSGAQEVDPYVQPQLPILDKLALTSGA